MEIRKAYKAGDCATSWKANFHGFAGAGAEISPGQKPGLRRMLGSSGLSFRCHAVLNRQVWINKSAMLENTLRRICSLDKLDARIFRCGKVRQDLQSIRGDLDSI